MRVTMRPYHKERGRTYLWEVLIDGKPIKPKHGTSRGRVLKMGNRYLTVLDGGSVLANFGIMSSRKETAEWVAECAIKEGFV